MSGSEHGCAWAGMMPCTYVYSMVLLLAQAPIAASAGGGGGLRAPLPSVGGGLILFGMSSMRQNPSVCGFVYHGATAVNKHISNKPLEVEITGLTLAELIGSLAPWARRGHRERLAVAYRQRALRVGCHMRVDPRALLRDERSRLRLCRERGLLARRREPWVERAADSEPLGVERE